MSKRAPNLKLEAQYKQQGERCIYCDTPTPYEFITKDHLIPASRGKNFVKNKVFACHKCNKEKGDFTIFALNSLDLREIKKILNQVVESDWKISKNKLERFRYISKRFVTIRKIINNGGKPKHIFT